MKNSAYTGSGQAANLVQSFNHEEGLSGAGGGGLSTNNASPLSEEQLTLLTLRFDENEFGYLPAAEGGSSYHQNMGQQTKRLSNNRAGEKEELPAVAAAFIPYSAYNFVREKKEHMSLDDLRGDLTTYSKLLEGKIMHHIHEDVHEAFVTISGHLGNMLEPLNGALRPLQSAKSKLERSVKHLAEADESITKALAEAQRHEAARQFRYILLQIELAYESACRVYEETVAAQEGMNLVVPPSAFNSSASSGASTGKGSYSVVKGSTPMDGSCGTTYAQHDKLVDTLAQHMMRLRGLWATLPLAASFLALDEGGFATKASESASLHGEDTLKSEDSLQDKVKEVEFLRRRAYGLIEETNKAFLHVLGTALYDAYLGSIGSEASLSTGVSSSSSPSPVSNVLSSPLPSSSKWGAATPAISLRRFSNFLSVYKKLGDEKELAIVYRDIIVRPLIESVVSWKSVGDARKSNAVILQILSNIKELLSEKVLHIVPLLRDTFGSSISPISDIVWSAVCDTLVKRLVFLFSPSLPDVLHGNFTAAQEILSLLESQCETSQELFELRNSTDMTMWLRKWNLEVYHVQRTQELNDALSSLFSSHHGSEEEGENTIFKCNACPTAIAPTNVLGLSTTASTALTASSSSDEGSAHSQLGDIYRYHFAHVFEGLCDIVMRTFSKSVFLLPIAPKQLKIAVTLLYNGLSCIVERVSSLVLAEGGSVRSPTTRPAGVGAGLSGQSCKLLCNLFKDLAVFESFVRKDFVLVAKASIGDLSSRGQSQLSASYALASTPQQGGSGSAGHSHALSSLFKLAAGCVSEKRRAVAVKIQEMLLEGTMPLLQQSLAAASTRSNVPNAAAAPMPTEASRFAVEAAAKFIELESLILDYKQGSSTLLTASNITSGELKGLLVGAGKDICAQYQSAVVSALQALYRRLKALQRVKRVAAGGGGVGSTSESSSAEITDFEKMVLQVYHDVMHVEKALHSYVGQTYDVRGTADNDNNNDEVEGGGGGVGASSVFRHYFGPLISRGEWIIETKVRGLITDAPAPALWAEVNEG